MDFSVPECDGRCCSAFALNAGALEALNAGKACDSEFILAMLIPLSPEEVWERTERFGLRWKEPASENFLPEVGEDGSPRFFTCRHWSEETRLCGQYDNRPRMCSKHPAPGEPCYHCGGFLRQRPATIGTPA